MTEVEQIFAAIAAIAAGLAGLLYILRQARRGVRWMLETVRRLRRQADAFLGDEERGIPSVPDRLDRVEKELHPNHGTSLRDAVDGLRADVTQIRGELEEYRKERDRIPVVVNVGGSPPTPTA